jgi:hypothetical protein
MTEFNIEVNYTEQKTYNVNSDTWEEAVELAAVMAENENLHIIGGLLVLDANYDPVNTWSKK